MTRKQLENKVDELQFWVDNNHRHPDHQHNLNLLKHYQLKLEQLNTLNA